MKMAMKIIRMIKTWSIYWSPDWLKGPLVTAFYFLHPHRPKVKLTRYEFCWFAQFKNEGFFTPQPNQIGYTRSEMLETYTLKSCVTIEEGDIVVDVGAFIGGFSLAVLDKASRVFAIEPDPANFMCLQRNLGCVGKCTLVKKALWNNDSTRELKLGYNATDSSLINVDGKSRNFSYMAEVIRLDSLMLKHNIEEIDFLKIDVEGAEPEVLQGAPLDKIKKVAIACGEERYGQATAPEVLSLLESAEFKVVQRKKDSRLILYGWRQN